MAVDLRQVHFDIKNPFGHWHVQVLLSHIPPFRQGDLQQDSDS